MSFPPSRCLAIFCVATGLATLSLTGCHSGSSSTTSAPPAIGAGATTAATSGATASGTDLAAKGCGAIKVSDVQPLLRDSISKIDFDPGSAELDPVHMFTCNAGPITITVYPEDSSKQQMQTDVTAENVPSHVLAGVGDSSVWTGGPQLNPNTYTIAPDVYAHQNSVTCEIANTGEGLTIPVAPGVLGGVTATDAATFAAKLGTVCSDVFGAIA